jgi:hypothetical protein
MVPLCVLKRSLFLGAIFLLSCTPSGALDAGQSLTIATIAGQNTAQGAFANGAALTQARFDGPEGLALDSTQKNLYIADSVNNAIRKLNFETQLVTTIAGFTAEAGFADSSADGGARLKAPRNLVLDENQTGLYFTDTGNHVIRHVGFDTNVVTTLFGSPGIPGFSDGVGANARFGRAGFLNTVQPWGGGMVIDSNDASSPTMYVADSANQTIRSIDLKSKMVKTVAGQAGIAGYADGIGTAAVFNKPSGVVIINRTLYVTEANSLTIRAIDLTTFAVTTVAGKAPKNPNHFCEDVSPVLPPECGSTDSAKGTEARFRFPFGVAARGNEGFFVVDSHNNLIRFFDARTTEVKTVAGVQQTVLDDISRPSIESTDTTPGTLSHPSHVVFAGGRTLYVADRSANCVRKIELAQP